MTAGPYARLVAALVADAPPLTVDQVDRIRAAFTEAAAIRAGEPHPVDARRTTNRRRAA